MTNKTFDDIANQIYRATTKTSWSFLDGEEKNYVFSAENRRGQKWFYTSIYDDFGMAEKPSLEIIELTTDKPDELKFVFQAYRDESGIRITIDTNNLEAKFERA